MITLCLLIAVVVVASAGAVELASITFPNKAHNFEEEKHTIHYSVSGSGCTVDGKHHVFGSVFTVSSTGPCIQYECKQSGVRLLLAQSGCENLVKCSQHTVLLRGCTKALCLLTNLASGNTIRLTRQLKIESEQRCNVGNMCHAIQTPFNIKNKNIDMECICQDLDNFQCTAK